MIFLDEVLECDDHTVLTAASITAENPFSRSEGVPAHFGIELMAQACGALAGIKARTNGQSPRFGYLLGTRRYHATVACFTACDRLEVRASAVYQDGEISVCDGAIPRDGAAIAEARLTLAQPLDAPLNEEQQETWTSGDHR